jgi:N-acetylmuramoyl-L-alanine amidase
LDICQHPSPNFGERRDGQRPELIVIHYTAMESAQAAIDWLCNPEAEVSAHYVIAPGGKITQLVAEEMRAWHAGVGSWQGKGDVNSRSIGIELSNKGDHPFAAAQMDVLEALLAEIMQRWDIGPDGVIGHSDMSPGRKIDPGPKFDWLRLARQGLAVWPDQAPAEAEWESCAK